MFTYLAKIRRYRIFSDYNLCFQCYSMFKCYIIYFFKNIDIMGVTITELWKKYQCIGPCQIKICVINDLYYSNKKIFKKYALVQEHLRSMSNSLWCFLVSHYHARKGTHTLGVTTI